MDFFDRKGLKLGAYVLQEYAQTEAHIRDIAECGLDMITCIRPKDRGVLDLFEKYGVGCITLDQVPTTWDKKRPAAGRVCDSYTREMFEKAAKEFRDHPAILGVEIGDEPSALDFDHYGRVVSWVNGLLPGKLPYLNLYPNYASVAENSGGEQKSQLGTASYAEHIAEYVKRICLPYISYDFYVYHPKKDLLGRMFDNFRIVANACLASGRDFWYVPQVNSRTEDAPLSEDQLRFQAYAALCYGATVINWACYTVGWWYNNVLDEQGNRTEQYEKLKTVNRELHRFGERYIRYARTATHLVGFEPFADFPDTEVTDAVNTGYVRDLRADGKLIVAEMAGRSDPRERALLVLNATDSKAQSPANTRVTFGASGQPELFPADGNAKLEKTADGFAFELENCRAALITLR